ncbi:MAG: succinylglutamate desuccinylase/aspartoacylase family protein [Polyangiaceae bacterium]|nr:succinylglutamate desuccinylase/aspartoacylase family protein [Polyangiaceae bacterium]MCW5791001.1 succinylglutamate desuccinylase/aspartoacylase family protein [Polyangiaceae bacterium]
MTPKPARPARRPQPARPVFELGGQRVEPGELQRLDLPVSKLPTGTEIGIPVAVAHGAAAGPTLWVSSTVHGDELNGVAIIRRVLKQLNPKALRGTVIAVSVVNVFGLLQTSRYLPDRRDLNRSFPGSPRGPLAARLAHLFLEEVVRRSDVGIDLHTGSDGRNNLPQIRCDLSDPATRSLARAFGAPVIVHAALRDGSLRAAARHLGIPALLYEGGEAHRFDPMSIEIGARGLIRVLVKLGMLEGPPPLGEDEPFESQRSTWIRSGKAGLCEIHATLGRRVSVGEVVATVFDTTGRLEHAVKTKVAGIVIGRSERALVHRGDALIHVAEPPHA